MLRRKMRRIFRRETDELQTWYRDGVWWPASPHGQWRQRSNVTVIGKVMSLVWCTFTHNSTVKVTEAPKSAGMLSVPRLTFRTTSKVKGQGHQAALGGCSSHHLQGRGILWRPHYRPHGLFVTDFLRTLRINELCIDQRFRLQCASWISVL